MKLSKLDPSLHHLLEKNVIIGLSGPYVDYIIRAGNNYFKKITAGNKEKFDTTHDATTPFQYSSF